VLLAARQLDDGRRRGAAPVEGDVVTGALGGGGERGAHRAGPDHGDVRHGGGVWRGGLTAMMHC
jgi:hypothetical protein